ncbi:sensor of ECF-type sigma factor [Flavobacterium agricola]|uniref:Sensor of ECF-type sigma factor n=1 Tax=Flavobacterium agricola TaxID=2870839 RepID=A0ABY6M223_9FLAO|nr:sensor of ECF-type sigma factor [Flavobacterium agricola]UYW02564.1 sensor of ECF-type sigma factor [Flavobacterium agricola]
MKKIIFLFLLIPAFVFAQNNENKREKIKQLKIAFITTELDLNSDEAAKFWPIYNAAENKIYDIKKIRYKAYSDYIKGKKQNEILEADAKKYINIADDCEKKIFEIKSELNQELGNTVSYKKIVNLKKAEDDFRQKLLEQYRKK